MLTVGAGAALYVAIPYFPDGGGSQTSGSLLLPPGGGQQEMPGVFSLDGVDVQNGGAATVSSVGGHAGALTNATIENGGVAIVSAGGAIDLGVVNGLIEVFGGAASGVTVKSDGLVSVFDGASGRLNGLVLSGGAISLGAGDIASGSTLRFAVSVGHQELESGATAVGTLISSGGEEMVDSGALTSAATVSAGGVEFVDSGGSATDVTVKSGGLLDLFSGAANLFGDFIPGGGYLVSGGMAESGSTVSNSWSRTGSQPSAPATRRASPA